MSLNKKILLLLCIIFLILLIFLCEQYFSLRPQIIVSYLDMNKTVIPTIHNCSTCGGSGSIGDWKYTVGTSINDNSDYPTGPFSSAPKNDVQIYYWVDGSNNYMIELGIVDYKLPIIAKEYYFLNDPRGRLKNIYWNFLYSKQNIIPPSWDWENNSADEDVALCGDGTEDYCTGWFYQARYGQYYLLIHYFQGLDYKSFEQVVQAINDQFIAELQ